MHFRLSRNPKSDHARPPTLAGLPIRTRVGFVWPVSVSEYRRLHGVDLGRCINHVCGNGDDLLCTIPDSKMSKQSEQNVQEQLRDVPEQVASRGPRFATADSLLRGTPRSLVLVNRAGSYATSFRGRRPLSVGCKEGSLGVATERSV